MCLSLLGMCCLTKNFFDPVAMVTPIQERFVSILLSMSHFEIFGLTFQFCAGYNLNFINYTQINDT